MTQRKRLEHEAKLNQEKDRREAIVRQMEEDQMWRKVKAEQEAAAATALAAAAAEASAAAAAHAAQRVQEASSHADVGAKAAGRETGTLPSKVEEPSSPSIVTPSGEGVSSDALVETPGPGPG